MHSFTDTHAHLSMLAKRGIDPFSRLTELAAVGFGSILDIGTEPDDLGRRIDSFSVFPFVRFTAGIWPSEDAIRHREEQVSALKSAATAAGSGLLVAVGECGFDRHWNRKDQGADIEGERELFLAQAMLAVDLDLPIVIHSREAAEETAEAIVAVPGLRGVVHCFSYGIDEARRFLDLGFSVSFAGTVTYKNAAGLRDAARFVPEDRLLLETDSPYLAPMPFRGKSAEPGMIEKTYETVAAARGVGAALLAEIAAGNAKRLFGLPTKF